MGRLGKREGDDRSESYDSVLEIRPGGEWALMEARSVTIEN
jgi:hypothetical protein